jgi:predicted ATPase
MMPEMLRIKGNIMAAMPGTDFTAAEACFYRALEMAEEQAALSWALRVAISLAQLYRARARNDEALRLLAPVYDRFTEGFNTADLKLARQILDDLRQPSTAAGSNR